MPFINERIAQNQQLLEQEKYEASEKHRYKHSIDSDKKPERPSRFRFDPHKVISTLQTRIVGQEHVLQAMEDVLLTVKADFNSPHRPLSVILFLGSTGVGKTETVRVIAEAILGSADKMCRIDMNTLSQAHYTAALTGSPPGYVGSKEGQTLFNADHIKGSFSEPGIVLFDEIEKANTDVLRALLNVLDTGKLALTSGVKELDFSNTLIFMTSNIGVREMTQQLAIYQKGWRRWLGLTPKNESDILDKALTEHFDPEFLNRIDRIIPFNHLHEETLDNLVSIELEKLNKQLGRRNVFVSLDKPVRLYLCNDYDARYGARSLARRMRLELEPKLAKALLHYPEDNIFTAYLLINTIHNTEIVVVPVDS